MDNNTENKRIAKNSIYLYIRTFAILLVSLYSVRVILDVLGVEDYGIYNAIGGVVAVFSFLANTLTSVSQRYFSFYIGKNDTQRLKQYFNTIYLVYVLISVIVLIIGETAGIWILNKYLTIPPDRFHAAKVVYQLSLLSLIFQFIVIPYNSVIIAREEMSVYAYISIFEALLKLGIVFLLVVIRWDALILYSLLLVGVSLLKYLFYSIYTSKKYSESRLIRFWNKNLFVEILGYLGWNTYGVFAAVFKSHGIVVVLNMFFGPIVNAAYAIAVQISGAVNQFVSSFLLAVQPQIVKKYAEDNKRGMFDIVFLSSRFSYYLVMIVAIPCIIELPMILKLWLKEVPDYTVQFSILLVITTLIDSLCLPLVTSIQATGKIKTYNLVIGTILFLTIPVCALAAKCGVNSYMLVVISLGVTFIGQIVRIWFLKTTAGMSVSEYCSKVIRRIIVVTLISILVPSLLSTTLEDSIIRLLIITIVSFISSLSTIYYLGLNCRERSMIQDFVKTKIFKKNG